MNEIEISGIFHEIVLVIAYLSGVIVSIITGRKNHIHPSVTFLMILICTLSFLLFAYYSRFLLGTYYPILLSGFPHINKSFGLLGITVGLFLSGIFLRIPNTVLYKFSLPFLIIYVINNLGCLSGHCMQVEERILHFPDSINLLASIGLSQILDTIIFTGQFDYSSLLRSILGLIAIIAIYPIRKNFNNPRNLFLLVLSSLLSISFIVQFFTYTNSPSALFDSLLGLNVFQWGILMVNSLVLFTLIANEYTGRRKFPRLKIKLPSNFVLFSIYLTIFIITFRDSSFLSDTNPNLFIIGFSLTTLFLMYYFHKKIRLSYMKYTYLFILLGVGVLFFQARFFTPEDNIQKDPLRMMEKKPVDSNSAMISKPYLYHQQNLKQLQFIRSHQLGHRSLSLSTLNSFTDLSLLKYMDSKQVTLEIKE